MNRTEAASHHYRRVTALALEVARVLGLSPNLEPLFENAARRVHLQECDASVLTRLSMEIEGHDRTIEGIIRMCHMLDRQLLSLPIEYKDIDSIFDQLESFAVFERFQPLLVNCLRDLRVSIPEIVRLPVQARIARRVFRCLAVRKDSNEIEELECVASQDPVLAGSLIQVANSARYGPVGRISTIHEAIFNLGTTATREILVAAAIRPLFASAGLLGLWRHSLQMAQLCSELAAKSGIMDPEEAVLLGLVHDVGSLAMQTLPSDTMHRYQRLVEHGCPPAYVEVLLCGSDHGKIGARILTGWNFAPHIIEAVEFHHQPERSASPIPSMVCLAEFWSGLDEDVPSLVRMSECAKRTGLSMECLGEMRVRSGALNVLRAVA